MKQTKAPEMTHDKLLRVLVPVDFTRACLNALRYANVIAERFGSTIYLLHVVESHPFAMNEDACMWIKSDEEVAHEAKQQLIRLAREELAQDVAVTPLVRRGQPAWEILQAADSVKADLLVLTEHRRSPLGRALLGSTAVRVERHAHCPVLVVPCGSDAGTDAELWRDAATGDEQLQRKAA